MTWRNLLSQPHAATLPWVGGGFLRSYAQRWKLSDPPADHGWYRFWLNGDTASDATAITSEPKPNILHFPMIGYLVGDRLVADAAKVLADPMTYPLWSERVYLVDGIADRFARISAGRVYENGPLIFRQQEMPLGAETALETCFLERDETCSTVKDVHPALRAAFQLEWRRRALTEERRATAIQRRREDEERRIQEEQRQALTTQRHSGVGRRAMAPLDFEDAARAALAISGAEYLEHHRHGEEMRVRFRLDGRRFECICDLRLRIVESGICLAGHDREAVLETLPSIIREGIRTNLLVVYRHV